MKYTSQPRNIMYETKIHNSIVELKKEDWDHLTENNVYMCYEYLKTFEETKTIPVFPYYIIICDEKKIVAAAVCYFEERNESRGIDNVLLGRLHKSTWTEKISFLPALFCNKQRGHGTHFLFSPGINQNLALTLQNKILDEIEILAKGNKAPVCFLNVTANQVQLMNNLSERGYLKTLDLPSNFMDISWSSFEGYKTYLLQRYPYMNKSVRHELNRNRKAGVVIKKLDDVSNCSERLLELLRMNHFKYYSSLFPLKENYFKKVKENFGSNAVIYTAIKDREIIGVSVVLIKGEEAFFSSIGVDHKLSQKDFTFFNLGYYEPLKDAVNFGIKRIYFGRGLYSTKIKRGCIAEEMFLFYKPAENFKVPFFKSWFLIHRNWMKHKVAQIKKL